MGEKQRKERPESGEEVDVLRKEQRVSSSAASAKTALSYAIMLLAARPSLSSHTYHKFRR